MIQKKNNYLKSIIRFLIQAGVTVALLVGVSIFHRGMYLIGVPKAEKVQYVTVSYPEVTDEEKKITDREQIRLAVQLTGFLRYSLLEEADSGDCLLYTSTVSLFKEPAVVSGQFHESGRRHEKVPAAVSNLVLHVSLFPSGFGIHELIA